MMTTGQVSMCGITGYVQFDSQTPEPTILDAMTHALTASLSNLLAGVAIFAILAGLDFQVKDLALADFGRKEIRLAEEEMPGMPITLVPAKGSTLSKSLVSARALEAEEEELLMLLPPASGRAPWS